MKSTRVFHNDKFLDYILTHSLEGTTIRLVAGVPDIEGCVDDEIAQLENAYRLTQNIDTAWIKSPAVDPAADPRMPIRSTSVGDVLQRGDKYFVVEECGFREINREEECGFVVFLPAKKEVTT